MMQYKFELIVADPAHLTAAAEPLNDLAEERWTVVALVPFDPGKTYLALLGREKEEREELLEPLAVDAAIDAAIVEKLPSPNAN
jgi:hypothetical protein